jgi:hypothetical protein
MGSNTIYLNKNLVVSHVPFTEVDRAWLAIEVPALVEVRGQQLVDKCREDGDGIMQYC